MSPRSFFVANFGCRASQSEGAAVEQELLDGMAMPAQSAFAADVVVVNKSDLPGADQTVADIEQQLHTSKHQAIPVVKTSVAKQQGIDVLCHTLDNRRAR